MNFSIQLYMHTYTVQVYKHILYIFVCVCVRGVYVHVHIINEKLSRKKTFKIYWNFTHNFMILLNKNKSSFHILKLTGKTFTVY